MSARSGAGRVFCLNFDAEEEMRRPQGYAPSRATEKAIAQVRERVLPGLTPLRGPGGVWLHELSAGVGEGERAGGEGARAASSAAAGDPPRVGRAWCPTPRARAALLSVGAPLEAAPEFEVICRVNASRFPYDVLGPRLEGAALVTDPESAEAHLMRAATADSLWFKRAFGAAGRGKVRAFGGSMAPALRGFLSPSELALGVVIEPDVNIQLEVSLHAELAPPREASGPEALPRSLGLRVGRPVAHQVERGQWRNVSRVALGEGAHELLPSELAELTSALHTLAESAAALGYFGPLGVDAYRYLDARGRRRWNPCGELNARYTMGHALGMSYTD